VFELLPGIGSIGCAVFKELPFVQLTLCWASAKESVVAVACAPFPWQLDRWGTGSFDNSIRWSVRHCFHTVLIFWLWSLIPSTICLSDLC